MAAPRPEAGTFEELAARYRPEIQAHCYRMLGSFHDAEDAAQETLLSAWRGLPRFEGRSSVRTWLYRIATNACLRAISRRRASRRVLPDTESAPATFAPLGPPDTETTWLEPYPGDALERLADVAPGPDARYEFKETIRLAFLAAIQTLPARQRAVLLLRDALGFTAGETAGVLDTSVTAVNSALQRARSTLETHRPRWEVGSGPSSDQDQRRLLERYVQAWEAGDVDRFVSLLRDDVIWTMPPWPQWYRGRAPVAAFLAWALRPVESRRHRLVATSANGDPAFGHYRSSPLTGRWEAFAIQVVSVGDSGIASITNFVDARLFKAFSLPIETDESGFRTVSGRMG